MSVSGTIEGSSATIWVVTAHALVRYVERIHRGITYRQAAEELQSQLSGAHFVKSLPSGLEQWRGPPPRRIRLRVQRDDAGPKVTTVLPAFDGLS